MADFNTYLGVAALRQLWTFDCFLHLMSRITLSSALRGVLVKYIMIPTGSKGSLSVTSAEVWLFVPELPVDETFLCPCIFKGCREPLLTLALGMSVHCLKLGNISLSTLIESHTYGDENY